MPVNKYFLELDRWDGAGSGHKVYEKQEGGKAVRSEQAWCLREHLWEHLQEKD